MKRWIWGVALAIGLVGTTGAMAQQKQNLSIVTGGTGGVY